MIAKSKAPMWGRAQRRHPARTLRAMHVGGCAPSTLLQRLLVLAGYWPENPQPAAKPVSVEAASRPKGKTIFGGIVGKVKRWFGR